MNENKFKPELKIDFDVPKTPWLTYIYNALSNRVKPYSYYYEYFRENVIPEDGKQREYLWATDFYPETRQYMTPLVSRKTGQLVEIRLDDEEGYNSAKKKLNFV